MSNTDSRGSAIPAAMSSSLFHTAPYPEGSFLEPFSPSGDINPHWQQVLEAFGNREDTSFERDAERVRRMRHQDGATINPFDSLDKQSTSWALDMIPFPISAEEWSAIESAVEQRALLLEKILADIYGPQELVKSGKIPPELIFDNRNFLHPCHGIQPSGNRFLTFYAVDIYRDSDGRFKVLNDFGSNPAGIGYALENRIVMSRIFGDLYHRTQIRRLAPFFKSFHQSLIHRTSLRKNDPGIVLFSPGPDNKCYFEQALLSRYLGYPLVEGQDLTVRNGQVFLKKLAGLERVEAIFRHIDDSQSDPFALRRETAKGVAGLIQACREQNVDVVSPIGSGFIETPALKLFLPDLCRQLLGEELKLENRPAWWCGIEDNLRHALENMGSLTVEPAMDRNETLSQNDDLADAFRKSPWQYMASAPVFPSVAPSWKNQGITSHYVKLRIFACAAENGFTVMPGGLAVTTTQTSTLLTGSPEQQHSKDLWVLSDEPVDPVSMMDGLVAIPEFKRSNDLPSRVADNLLWLGRYLERAEGLIRLLRPVYRRLAGEARPEEIPELQFLLDILTTREIIPGSSESQADGPLYLELFHHLHEALYQRDKTDSVVSILKRIQETAQNVRDRLSVDSFSIINRLEDFTGLPTSDPLELLDKTLFTLSGFSGLAMESMTRGLGWRFMDMGRRVERAISQAALIRTALPRIRQNSSTRLQALLEVSDSLMTYRSRYRSTFQLAPVLDLLLADESNPKSLAFQLAQLVDHITNMPQQNERKFSRSEERIALKMLTNIRLLDLTEILRKDQTPEDESLTIFLESMESLLKEFSQQVSAHYLSRVPATPHYSAISGNFAQ